MAKRYWLMKVEPDAYSIAEFEKDGETAWEGVRNYQARNTLRDDMQVGDGVLFYQSSADPTGVAGVAEVSKAGYPDASAWDKKHDYYDPKSDPANPTWYMVNIRFKERFAEVVSLAVLKSTPGLEDMMVTKRGMRLSVQPVKPDEFETVLRLGRAKTGAPAPKHKPAGTKAKAKKRNAAAKRPARKRK